MKFFLYCRPIQLLLEKRAKGSDIYILTCETCNAWNLNVFKQCTFNFFAIFFICFYKKCNMLSLILDVKYQFDSVNLFNEIRVFLWLGTDITNDWAN